MLANLQFFVYTYEKNEKIMQRHHLFYLVAGLSAAGLLYYFMAPKHEENGNRTIPTVQIKTVEPQKMRIWSEFSGRLQAVDSAEIRPQVSGRITEVRFEDGAMVNAGDILFVIDPRPYEAAVSTAEAKLATAKSNAYYAKLELDRAEKMVKTQAIAQRIFDERFNSNEVSNASIKSAEAELKQANVDLEHAYVRAPITGRAGRVELTVGNLVQAGPNAPLMTLIVANEPIYADFEVDEQTYLDTIRTVANTRKLEQEIPVELFLEGDRDTTYKGYIYTFDNRLDPATGTIRARAKFDNKDGSLIPGMFVTVALASGDDQSVILLPQSVISTDQNKKFVYVVDQDNKVVYRELTLGKEVKGRRIILKGLEPKDRVIVNGYQRVRPGQTVKAEEEKTQ